MSPPMTPLLFKNARIFDGTNAECVEGMHLRVSDGFIQEVSARPITDKDARVIDVGGRTLMPGLIDAHMHAYCSDVSMQKVEAMGEPYRTAHAVRMLGHALDCGFTTVRDIGGGDYSLAKAIADGLVRAPRFFYAGKVLSMTGGHGDFRPLEQKSHHHELCSCGIVNWACRVADGVDACIQAARDELRQRAHCIKIMGSGGVASPTDPIWMNQYREDEIRAIVNECTERRTYVAAHCHPASAVQRCVEFGVRSIEHGTLIDDDTARFVAERGAYIVPTMVVIFALVEMGPKLGFPAVSQEKAEYAYKQALSGMDKMRRAGVKVGFGTDLLGTMYVQECREFTIRSEVFSPLELLRQATSVNAELMMRQGKLGCIAPGAHADLLVVDGDPLRDISLLAADGKNLRLIVRGGEIVKDELR
jgi:imidazolonepropionase-like amidohydrolase